MKYDDIRDDSFDFLSIGEDDTEDYDDFVWSKHNQFKTTNTCILNAIKTAPITIFSFN